MWLYAIIAFFTVLIILWIDSLSDKLFDIRKYLREELDPELRDLRFRLNRATARIEIAEKELATLRACVDQHARELKRLIETPAVKSTAALDAALTDFKTR